jgi:hypothetical protein
MMKGWQRPFIAFQTPVLLAIGERRQLTRMSIGALLMLAPKSRVRRKRRGDCQRESTDRGDCPA